jgi:hypothetical protein
VYKFYSQSQERLDAMERVKKLPRGKASIDKAEAMWKDLKDNDNLFNSEVTPIPPEYTPPSPAPPPPAEPSWFDRWYGGLEFSIKQLYGVPY